MAKCLGPAHSTEARGAVGPLNYNTWRGVRVIKQKTGPSQPRTQRQLLVRSELVKFARLWAGLTSAQRAAWTTWANDHPTTDWTGSSRRMTGMNAYAKANFMLQDTGNTLLTSPPAVNPPEPIAGLALTPGSGTLSVAWTPTGGTATQVDIWLWGPHSAGQIAKLARARHSFYGPGETSPKAYSALAAGTWTVYIRAVSETTGLVSSWVTADAVVT